MGAMDVLKKWDFYKKIPEVSAVLLFLVLLQPCLIPVLTCCVHSAAIATR
jgi:hypothetical protein